MTERFSTLDSSSGVIRVWVREPAMAFVSLSKTLNHAFLQMGHKAVGPVHCECTKKNPGQLPWKRRGLPWCFWMVGCRLRELGAIGWFIKIIHHRKWLPGTCNLHCALSTQQGGYLRIINLMIIISIIRALDSESPISPYHQCDFRHTCMTYTFKRDSSTSKKL